MGFNTNKTKPRLHGCKRGTNTGERMNETVTL